MTDPWITAAQRISSRRAKEQQQQEAAQRMDMQRQTAEASRAQAAQRAMREAIATAVTALTGFLAERGAAAQRLLAACGDNAYVTFGYVGGGGFYQAIYLGGQGLRCENSQGGDYNRRPTDNKPATPQQAVEFFARHGAGQNDPERVRNIVPWLTQQIESYAARGNA